MANVAVIGTGYVGSVTGACLAKVGHEVTLVDNVPEKVETIMEGRAPIDEPRLDEIIRDAVNDRTLRATTELGKAVRHADVILLSLPTPSSPDGSANMSFVFGVADELGHHIKENAVIATRSTVPVGTTETVGKFVAAHATVPFFAVSNPEFLAEGRAVEDTLHPSRIIIGSDSDEADKQMRRIYHPLVLDNPGKILSMDVRSAEMSKLAGNTYLATDIIVGDKIAEICEAVGADYREVQRGMSFDPRIGKFTHPGPGYGGSCFPKDVQSLAHIGRHHGVDTTIFDLVTETNEYMKRRPFEKLKEYFQDDLHDLKIAVLGLSFKPNTDDIRESAALGLIDDLLKAGADVSAYDPKAMERTKDHFLGDTRIDFAANKYDAAKGADAIVIVTEWDQFKSLDFDHLSEIMKQKVVFDARSIYDRSVPEQAGFYYDSVGRQPVTN